MPGVFAETALLGKRKRELASTDEAKVMRRLKTSRAPAKAGFDSQRGSSSDIARLEAEIQVSQRHYNNIKTLLRLSTEDARHGGKEKQAKLSLCRVFSRLLSEGRLRVLPGASENEAIVTSWLRECFSDYQKQLLVLLKSETGSKFAMTLLMQLTREEILATISSPQAVWRSGVFSRVVLALVSGTTPGHQQARMNFTTQYINAYDDVKQHTFALISKVLGNAKDLALPIVVATNCLEIMSEIDPPSDGNDEAVALFCPPLTPASIKSNTTSRLNLGQKAWTAVLNSGLSKRQRKTALGLMTYRIVPWFTRVEMLMDFLTDSFESGGATSLLALSGLFHLMRARNLDYPGFYPKLYSLLDAEVLHSKHRSRFFRLLDTFMASSHLPSTMVASFVKRLARLALRAPPAAIVAVVPWIYNMLKAHPACTFMIHREPCGELEREQLAEHGMTDPFDMDETDPTKTGALESSLWELETLQSHYHPNVASLAKIISEPFTKASYNLEDFLDHSYTSLIEADLGRDLKRTPVIEYEIPKRIFAMSDDAGGGQLEALMVQILAAAS